MLAMRLRSPSPMTRSVTVTFPGELLAMASGGSVLVKTIWSTPMLPPAAGVVVDDLDLRGLSFKGASVPGYRKHDVVVAPGRGEGDAVVDQQIHACFARV